MFSHFFIDRPIFATVISIVIVLVGLAAMMTLPIAQYPEITPPVVTISVPVVGLAGWGGGPVNSRSVVTRPGPS